MKNLLKTIGCLGLMIYVPVSMCIRGYVLSILWRWFVVDTFHVPAIHIAQAIGLSIIVGLFTVSQTQSSENKKTDVWEGFGALIGIAIAPFITLGVAWIVKLWI